MATADVVSKATGEAGAAPAFLVLDTESVPDGKLLSLVKYADEHLSAGDAVARAQAEARERSRDGSDFLPVSFQYPVAVCVARVGPDFRLQALTCLDAPQFRPREIVEAFWRGVARYGKAKLVTFNGRGFDLPLLELAAFRYGCSGPDYFRRTRNRFNGHLDLMDWLSNTGACRIAGGLSMMAQRSAGGVPAGCGKLDVSGEQVYEMYKQGRLQEINDYCMFDTIDTYFVFLRTRVVVGEMSLDDERNLARRAREWLGRKAAEVPVLEKYLRAWDRTHP